MLDALNAIGALPWVIVVLMLVGLALASHTEEPKCERGPIKPMRRGK